MSLVPERVTSLFGRPHSFDKDSADSASILCQPKTMCLTMSSVACGIGERIISSRGHVNVWFIGSSYLAVALQGTFLMRSVDDKNIFALIVLVEERGKHSHERDQTSEKSSHSTSEACSTNFLYQQRGWKVCVSDGFVREQPRSFVGRFIPIDRKSVG